MQQLTLESILRAVCAMVIALTAQAAVALADQPDSVESTESIVDRIVSSRKSSLDGSSLAGGYGGRLIPGRFDEQFARRVSQWEQQAVKPSHLKGYLKILVDSGPSVAPVVNKRLKDLKPDQPAATDLAFVLRSVGDAESIPVLIDLLEKATPRSGEPRIGWQQSTDLACTAALWRLAGREHVYSPKQWRKWWKVVKDDFVPAHRRGKRLVDEQRVEELISQLGQPESTAVEQLIVYGSKVLPICLAALEESDDERQQQLAFVIDEFGETEELPAKVRREYFISRFERLPGYAERSPLEEQARLRALEICDFADFCRIVIETDRQRSDRGGMQTWGWVKLNHKLFQHKFGKQPQRFAFRGGRLLPQAPAKIDSPVTPLADPAAAINAAVPVLVAALKDDSQAVRRSAAQLANTIGFTSDQRPQDLIDALISAWQNEVDGNLSIDLGLAMSRYPTPQVHDAIRRGLWSEKTQVLSGSASFVSWAGMRSEADFADVYERLVELTRHEDDKVRRRSVNSLRSVSSKRLLPHLDRLAKDALVDIRQECIYVMAQHPHEKHARVLLQLADDKSKEVRTHAISTLGDRTYTKTSTRLVPYLKDKEVGGWAVAAIVEASGKRALPWLMRELKDGNDIQGNIYQHLTRLTGEKFEQKPAPWLAWWEREHQK